MKKTNEFKVLWFMHSGTRPLALFSMGGVGVKAMEVYDVPKVRDPRFPSKYLTISLNLMILGPSNLSALIVFGGIKPQEPGVASQVLHWDQVGFSVLR